MTGFATLQATEDLEIDGEGEGSVEQPSTEAPETEMSEPSTPI